MRNILRTVLGLGALAAVRATRVIFLDNISGSTCLSSSVTSNHTMTHDIDDNGFNCMEVDYGIPAKAFRNF